MKKQAISTVVFTFFALIGVAQTAVTGSKTPATEPAKNDTVTTTAPIVQKVVSGAKNAGTAPANEKQTIPAATEEKAISSRKNPE